MLFHIVDDEKYNKAINNISKLLTKDGFFIFSDVFLHSESKCLEHYVARSKKEIEEVIRKHGFEIIKRRPVFFFMHTPIDTHNKFIHWVWKMQNKIIHRGYKWANLLGFLIYPIEIIMINLFKEGPSTEIMICRKK